MRPFNDILINAASAAVSANSVAVDASFLWQCSVHVVATGSPSATVKIQVSNDVVQAGVAPTSWIDLPSATVSVSAAGQFLIPKTDLCYQWLRVALVSGGTGAITATIKTIGT